MIDRTTFDLRIAEHDMTTARVNEADWQRQHAAGSTNPATTRGTRQRGRFTLRARLATAATILGCATALAFGGLSAAGEAPGQVAAGPAAASGAYRIWTGTCRAGGSDCLPDEDFLSGAPAATSGAHAIWTGTCRAGGSDCLPGDDDTAPGVARTLPRAWTGTCRAGSSACLPDEDFILGVAPAAPTGDTAVSDRVGPREFLANEGPISGTPSATGTEVGLREYLDGEAAATAASTPGGYRLSTPNETDPDGSVIITAPAQQPVAASTSEQFRWAFGATSGMTTPDLAMLPPSLQNLSA